MSAEPPEIGSNQSVSTQTDPPTLITHLPDDALCRCLATVPFRDRAVLSRVCSSWRNAVASKSFVVARRELAEPLWLVIGGQTSENFEANFDDCVVDTTSNQCHIFDVSLQPVARLKNLPQPSLESGAATIPGLGVLLLGGWVGDKPPNDPLTEACWVHDMDPSSSWRRWADLPAQWGFVECIALGDYVYAMSDCFVGVVAGIRNSICCYDKQGNLLKTLEKPKGTHPSHLLVLNDKLVVVDESHSRMDSLDPETDTWQRLPDLPMELVFGTAAVASLAGKIYVMGGRVGRSTTQGRDVADVHIFDGHEWSAGPPLPFPARLAEYFTGATASADSILFVAEVDERVYSRVGRVVLALRGGTWRVEAGGHINPRSAITSYCA